MRYFLSALVVASAAFIALPAAPAKAGGVNCWWEYTYAKDDHGNDTTVILKATQICEVESEEVTP